MKKILFLFIIIIFGLYSCSHENKPNDKKSSDSTSVSKDTSGETPEHKILFGNGNNGNQEQGFVGESPAASPEQAEKIVNQVLNNRGGEEAIKNIKSVSMLVKMKQGDAEIPLKVYSVFPDKIKLEMEVQGKKLTSGMNGNVGWATNPMDGKINKLSPEEFKMFKQQFKQPTEFFISPLYQFKKNKLNVEFLGERKDDNVDAFILKVNEQQAGSIFGGGQILIFVDTKTMLDYKYIIYVKTKDGESLNSILLKNNSKVKGFIFPHIIENYTGNQLTGSYILDNIAINEKIDDKIFEIPQ